MAIPPDDLFARQERQLNVFMEARNRKLLTMLESARRDIQGRIGDVDTFTTRRALNIADQIDEIILQVNREIIRIGPSAPELARMSKRHMEEAATAIAGRNIIVSIDALNTDALRAFSRNELRHVTALVNAEKETVKSLLFSRVGVQGQNPRQVARELAGRNSQFAGRYGHLQTIFRTETATVYNQQKIEAIKEVNEKYDLKLNKRIIETIDAGRNHPISQVLNGQVQEVDKPFKARVSEVKAAAARLKKSSGGIFWPQKDGFYQGMKLPAHYNDRGVVVPTKQPVNVK